jgi:hypothetical protein
VDVCLKLSAECTESGAHYQEKNGALMKKVAVARRSKAWRKSSSLVQEEHVVDKLQRL